MPICIILGVFISIIRYMLLNSVSWYKIVNQWATDVSAGQSTTNNASVFWTSLLTSVIIPQSVYNTLSIERYYDPDSNVYVYEANSSITIYAPVPTAVPTIAPKPT